MWVLWCYFTISLWSLSSWLFLLDCVVFVIFLFSSFNHTNSLYYCYANYNSSHLHIGYFNATTSLFDMSFEVDVSIVEPTVVYAHFELNYPNGVDISIFPLHSLTHKILLTQNLIEFSVVSEFVDGLRKNERESKFVTITLRNKKWINMC